MPEWTITHRITWHICADGKELASCETEKQAEILLDSIRNVETSKQISEQNGRLL
jgi:hypothetical protein